MQLPQESVYALIAGGAGLVFAFVMAKKVLAHDRGNDAMKEIQDNIAVGAMTFLKREYRVLSIFVLAVAVILALALSGDIAGLGVKTSMAFVAGALCSSLCGFGGMKTATAANSRTTQAATHSVTKALNVAFPGGVVMGMLVMSVGIIGRRDELAQERFGNSRPARIQEPPRPGKYVCLAAPGDGPGDLSHRGGDIEHERSAGHLLE